MAQAGRAERRSGRPRGRAWAIGVSLAVHAAALAVLAWTTPLLRMPVADWRPDITIELKPPPPLRRPTESNRPQTRGVTAPATPAAPVLKRRAAPAPPPPRPVPAPLPPRPLPSIPSPPRLAPAAAAASGAATRPGPAAPGRSADPGAPGGDVHGAVRAIIGCNYQDFLHLSPAERERCERQMAETPHREGAYVDPIPPLKRGLFDRQAAADARRRDHEGSMDNPLPQCPPGTPGSNFAVSCLPSSAMHRIPFGATPRAPAPDPQP